MINGLSVFQRVEFPMPSNNFSFSLANRCWDLLEKEGVYQDIFRFDKVKEPNYSRVEPFLLPRACSKLGFLYVSCNLRIGKCARTTNVYPLI